MKRKQNVVPHKSNKSVKLEEDQNIVITSSEEEEEEDSENSETEIQNNNNNNNKEEDKTEPKHRKMIRLLETEFKKISDKNKAKGMKKYMRDQFEFFGIQSQDRRNAQSAVFSKFPALPFSELELTVRGLWEKEEREYQHAALDLLHKYKKNHTGEYLPLYEHLIRSKSWWDTVDTISGNGLGWIVQSDPSLKLEMEKWIDDEYLWIRRSAILHQLKYRDKTDHAMLFSFCEKQMGDKDFFIRKAIGWALRQYSRSGGKQRVAEFVKKNEKKLSPLSLREAKKYL